MKNRTNGRRFSRLLFLALAGVVCCAQCLRAAREPYDIDLKEIRQTPYDIDLKELRHSPPGRKKTPRRKHPRKTVLSAAPAPDKTLKENSVYTVQPGDIPFLILTRHYGLSNDAAERMVPEIMRLNNLPDPRKLTVGQRLIIPAVPAGPARSKNGASRMPPPAPVPPPVTQAPSTRPSSAKVAPVPEIELHSGPPCRLAREVADLLGLSIPSVTAIIRTESASMAYKDRKLVVACALTAAEMYTYQRILMRHGAKPLFFNGDEQPREVIGKLADSLGISFQPANNEAGNELPATYLFSAADSLGRDVRVTILPAPATTEKVLP